MYIRTIMSAALVASIVGFSGAAYAQTMIGNQNVSESDMERVKVYCEALKTADEQTEDTNAVLEEEIPTPGTVAENSTAAIGAVDLDAVTLLNCIEAGFVER